MAVEGAAEAAAEAAAELEGTLWGISWLEGRQRGPKAYVGTLGKAIWGRKRRYLKTLNPYGRGAGGSLLWCLGSFHGSGREGSEPGGLGQSGGGLGQSGDGPAATSGAAA